MKRNIRPIVRLGGTVLLALSAAFTARADYSSTVLSQNPAAYFKLNENVPPAPAPLATNIGSLGSSANGTFVALPTLNAAGPFAGSVSVGLDGSSQAISTPWAAGLNTAAFSFEIWVKPTQSPYSGSVAYVASSFHSSTTAPGREGWYLAQDNGATFGHGNSFVARLFAHPGAGSTTPSITLWAPVLGAGVWHHLVLTYDGTTATLYENGVVASGSGAAAFVPNSDSAFTVGYRSDAAFNWPGSAAEAAIYGAALSPSSVSAHYAAATNAPATYAATVLSDSPLLYDRYQAPPNATIVNSGTLGTAYNGILLPDAQPGAPGPIPPVYTGFNATNTSICFDAQGGAAQLPAFNFNTNTITISGWVNATNLQESGAGIIVCDSGTTGAGLIIDGLYGGLGLGYYWNNTAGTYNWSPATAASLPSLPDSSWAYVALVIQPTEADIYIATTNNGGTFSAATNYFNHVNQAFGGPTLVGTDAGDPNYSFNGAIDEVGIWNRSLASGDLYTQFASAVGGLMPIIFSDPPSPSQPIVAGDTLTLTVNAGGTPNLGYQWLQNGNPLPAPAGTNAVYVKSNFSIAGDSGNYSVIVTNLFGSATSGVAVVTGQLATAPVITQRPVGGTIYPSGTLNLFVGASGGGLVYQWSKGGVPITGATQPVLMITNLVPTNSGSYTVSVTNSLGATNVGPAVVTVPTVAPGTYASLIISNQPTAWWRLDETNITTGAILYDAVGLHNGVYTNNGGLTVTPGAIGAGITDTAITFNGDGSYALVPYFSALSGAKFTLELWAKQTVVTPNVTAASSWDTSVSPAGFDIGAQTYWDGANADYAVGQSGPLNNYDPTINPGQWVHIVLEYGGNGNASYPWQIYINGYNDGTYIYGDASPLNSSKPFIIGGRGTGLASILNRYFVGSVDEVAFYNYNLTSGQVLADYTAAFAGIPPSFTVQPKSQNAIVGDNVTLSVNTAGAPPIAVQWKKNGVNLTLQTNNTLTLTNVTYATSSDVYNAVATNSAGSAVSSNAVVTVYPAPTFANLTNGLVLHLPFDGNYSDTSGHGNNGVASGTTFAAGKLGASSLVYQTVTLTNVTSTSSNVTEVSSTYVDLGTGYGTPGDLQFGPSVNFSVSLWVKLPTGYTGGDLPFIGTAVNSFNNPGWVLGPTYGTGGWQWGLSDGTNTIDVSGAASSINDGNWHNFVLTVNRSANTASAYLDGAPLGSRDITGMGSLDDGQLVTIGQDPTYGYPGSFTASQTDLNAWSGLQTANLDDVGIWRRALTDIEARSIYYAGQNYGKSFDVPGLVTLSTYSLPGGKLGIEWLTGTLQQSTSLTGPWTTVSGATPPSYQVTPAGTGNMFYRVAQ
jgi:hypothetical protein